MEGINARIKNNGAKIPKIHLKRILKSLPFIFMLKMGGRKSNMPG
jgi:hypothetical protein